MGLIGFEDADCFYASCEALRRPWLKNLPVGVCGNQGACVIARNYVMRKYGVSVGEAVWEAKKKCPDGIYVKRDFRWYEEVSRRLLAEVGTFSPKVEFYSIDECFWEGLPVPKQTYARSAVTIRDHLKAKVGVPVTVAFARTRTLAKLFADTSKPFGAVAVEDRAEERERLARLPVTEIAGIAKGRAAKLGMYGIKSCLDLANAHGLTIRRVLTVSGHDLWRELNGEPVTPIRPKRVRHKTISRGGSLAGKVTDGKTLYGWLARNVERLVEELEYHQVRPAVLNIQVSYFDHPGASGTVRLDVPSDRFDTLMEAAKVGLTRVWFPGRIATHMHLIASDLKRQESWPRSLFDPDDERAEALARLKREVNERFGRFKLRSGATLYVNRLYADPANDYDVCDIRDKFCF